MSRTQISLFCCSIFSLVSEIAAQSQFKNIALESNIIHCHTSPDLQGGGVGIIDINNDGLEDIYFTGGLTHDRLYLNQGSLQFKDITFESEIYYLSRSKNITSVTIGDLNNDGFDDVFLTTRNSHPILAVNNKDNTFSDVTLSSGIANYSSWGMAANLIDVNQDGLLDIYVSNYIQDPEALFDSARNVNGFAHKGWENHLFVNQGELKFTEEGSAFGVNSAGCTLSSLSTDINDDGYLDILVINDYGEWVIPNQAYIFEPVSKKFVDMAGEFNLADSIYGMGVAVSDVNNNGLLDYYITNIGRNVLRTNQGGRYEDELSRFGLYASQNISTNPVSWGCTFVDIDNDSYEDLYVTNGEIKAAPFLKTIESNPNYLFKNDHGGGFKDISAESQLDFPIRSRGLARADLNNDGYQELIINNIEPIRYASTSNVQVLLNTSSSGNNWFGLSIKDRNNKYALGAKVYAYFNSQTRMRQIKSGGSHASSETPRIVFGMEQVSVMDSIVVIWPDRTINTYVTNALPVNNYFELSQTEGLKILDCNGSNWGCTDLQESLPLQVGYPGEPQLRYYNDAMHLIFEEVDKLDKVIIYNLSGKVVEHNSSYDDSGKGTVLTIRLPHKYQNEIIILRMVSHTGAVRHWRIKVN